MALLNTAVALEETIALDGVWGTATLTSDKDRFCFVALKDSEITANLSNERVSKIKFEIGVDSGIEDTIITLTTFDINFNDETSSDKEINNTTALVRVPGLPSKFYYRPVSMEISNPRSDGAMDIKYTIEDKIEEATVETDIALNVIYFD